MKLCTGTCRHIWTHSSFSTWCRRTYVRGLARGLDMSRREFREAMALAGCALGYSGPAEAFRDQAELDLDAFGMAKTGENET